MTVWQLVISHEGIHIIISSIKKKKQNYMESRSGYYAVMSIFLDTHKQTHGGWLSFTRTLLNRGPYCAVICNLINSHTGGVEGGCCGRRTCLVSYGREEEEDGEGSTSCKNTRRVSVSPFVVRC